MKFLCLACDEPMKLTETAPPSDGAGIRASFHCPRCGSGVAMLANLHETEVVHSLGVRIGDGVAQSRCPFGAMTTPQPAIEDGGLTWTAGALARLERIPEMVRPMARQGIERYAKSAGRAVVDEALLETARAGLVG